MSETEQDALEPEMIDPPESQGGSGAAAASLEGGNQPKPLDPPDGNGGTGGG